MFEDIYPGAKTHLLLIPKRHIRSVKQLQKTDITLITHMKEIAIKYMKEQHQAEGPEQVLFGFHVPLFTTVHHLHPHMEGELNTSEVTHHVVRMRVKDDSGTGTFVV